MTQTKIVVMSGYHDYRSNRKANIHFISKELSVSYDVSFLSFRYSYLTKTRDDPRHDLWNRSNSIEISNGVKCYLWRSYIHPFRMPSFFSILENILFSLYSRYMPHELIEIISSADIILIESGICIIYAEMIKRLNPSVRLIYLASDGLTTINQANFIKRKFNMVATLFESARVPSPYLASEMPLGLKTYYIPHGIDKNVFRTTNKSPFDLGTTNAVSVGSMLFDESFFLIASEAFPHVNFHIIGGVPNRNGLTNVRYYSEMPFHETLPFLKHANIAIAAYGIGVHRYLTHTSMKLIQYEFLGVPAVCPLEVSGGLSHRFGYKIGDVSSIISAVQRALDSKHFLPIMHMSWSEVTDRILNHNVSLEMR